MPSGTIAVQAGGVDVAYPKENAGLADEITKSGLRLSEMPLGLAPQARHFPQRNRIVSGLAEAVVVVEGAARSGSLITARTALDQGREVMAVPGHPLDARAAGCNMLIRDGALLVRSAEDVIGALDRPSQEGAPETCEETVVETRAEGPSDGLPSRILALLSASPIAEDALIRAAGAPAQEVLATLAEMTMSGAIHRQPGGLVCSAA